MTKTTKGRLIEAASLQFQVKDWQQVTMKSISQLAKVGEVTVYRYFSSKENLLLACGISFWGEVQKAMEAVEARRDYAKLTGHQQVGELMQEALRFYQRKREGFRIIQQIDQILLSGKGDPDWILAYAQEVSQLEHFFTQPLAKGLEDGTIRLQASVEELYYTLTHACFSLMSKLSMGELLASDAIISEQRELELLVSLLLKSLQVEE